MPGKFEIYEDKAGKYRFRLKASNGQVVASGEAYETKAAAKKGCESVQQAARGAIIVDVDHLGGARAMNPTTVASPHPMTRAEWTRERVEGRIRENLGTGGYERWDGEKWTAVEPPADRDERRWRVGTHYGIHVYAVTPPGHDDEPVATFLGDPHTARLRAQQAVDEHNHTLAAAPTTEPPP